MGAVFLGCRFSNPWRCLPKRLHRRLMSLFAPKRVFPRWHALPCAHALVPRSRHGERSWLALLRQSHLLWNLQTCKWERLGVFLWLKWGEIHQLLLAAGAVAGWQGWASLRSACCGEGGDALSLRCRQRRASLGRAAPSLVSFVRSSPEMLRGGCNEGTMLSGW